MFLLRRKDVLPGDARFYGDDYQHRCRDYLAQALAPEQPREVLAGIEGVLSNPMDLTVIALMLAQGEKPELFHLQEQQYRFMANDYKRVNVGQEFPRNRFSEQVYQMRVNDAAAIPEQDFQEELLCMERHKLVVRRHLLSPSKEIIAEWNFRHDKITDFFVVQTFLVKGNQRPQQHLGDPRFRGVYFQLATLLPSPEAEALRELLIIYAADTNDHTVSVPFIQLLRSRKAA